MVVTVTLVMVFVLSFLRRVELVCVFITALLYVVTWRVVIDLWGVIDL